MSTPTPAETQAAVAALHRTFCDATSRMEALRFHERTWTDLLRAPEYEYDAARLTADVLHLVRYLQRGIREGKRNAGALKLVNFLQVDRFLADLAEAKVEMRPRRAARPDAAQTRELPDGSKVAVLAPSPAKLDVPRADFIEGFKQLREGMKGGQ